MKAENDPKALEKKMQELGREGRELRHVTMVVSSGRGENIITTSRI